MGRGDATLQLVKAILVHIAANLEFDVVDMFDGFDEMFPVQDSDGNLLQFRVCTQTLRDWVRCPHLDRIIAENLLRIREMTSRFENHNQNLQSSAVLIIISILAL